MSPSKPQLADPGALIRAAKLPEREFRVCVEPDLVAEYERLTKVRDDAKAAGADSMAGADTGEVDKQIADVQKQMTAATVVLRLRALGRRRWRELRDEHPPQKDADGNVLPSDILGVNFESFFNALLRESIIEPALDAETLDLLLDERLTDRQWMDLTDVAWNLNEARISVPFSPAASPTRKSSAPK